MKRALKIILFTAAGLCLLAIIAGYVVLTQVDFNSYKNVIIKTVYDATGRRLEIGDIQVKPSFNPVVEVRDLTLSNAEWAKTPVMASVKSVELGIAIIPLLKKNFEINTFTVSEAVVNLEENAAGKANWEFSAPNEGQAAAAVRKEIKLPNSFGLISSAYAADEMPRKNNNDGITDLLSSLVIRQVALEDVKINYTDKAAKTQSYNVKKLSLDENSDGNIDFDFDVNNGLYAGKGMLGALEAVNSKSGYPFKGNLDVMGIQIAIDMKLFDLLGNLRFDGNVQAKNFIGKDSGYNESADVSFSGDLNKVDATIKSFKLAGNEITGTINADLAGKVPAIRGSLKSPKIDMASFAKKQKTAFRFSLINEAQATTLVPSETIPYQALYSVNANVDMAIARLVNGNAEIGKDIAVNATVNNGAATVKILRGNIAAGKVTANAALNASGKTLTLKADIIKLNLQQLLTALGTDSSSFKFMNGSDTDVYVNLNGQGRTYAEIVDSLNGSLVGIVDKSQLHLGNIGVMKGNIISQLFNTLNLTKGNDDLNVRCAVVRADFKNGKAEFPNGVVLNADKFTVVASGDINLKKDSISMSVKPFAGKLTDTNIAKALSSLVKLTGTLQNPKIGVDSANAIKTIVGVTTAGPVYLGTQMLLENDGSPCYTALQGTGYENRFPKSDNVVTQTTGDVGKVLDDSVGIVKDTTKGILNILSGGKGKKGTAE